MYDIDGPRFTPRPRSYPYTCTRARIYTRHIDQWKCITRTYSQHNRAQHSTAPHSTAQHSITRGTYMARLLIGLPSASDASTKRAPRANPAIDLCAITAMKSGLKISSVRPAITRVAQSYNLSNRKSDKLPIALISGSFLLSLFF